MIRTSFKYAFGVVFASSQSGSAIVYLHNAWVLGTESSTSFPASDNRKAFTRSRIASRASLVMISSRRVLMSTLMAHNAYFALLMAANSGSSWLNFVRGAVLVQKLAFHSLALLLKINAWLLISDCLSATKSVKSLR